MTDKYAFEDFYCHDNPVVDTAVYVTEYHHKTVNLDIKHTHTVTRVTDGVDPAMWRPGREKVVVSRTYQVEIFKHNYLVHTQRGPWADKDIAFDHVLKALAEYEKIAHIATDQVLKDLDSEEY